jgi:hypothetical protein
MEGHWFDMSLRGKHGIRTILADARVGLSSPGLDDPFVMSRLSLGEGGRIRAASCLLCVRRRLAIRLRMWKRSVGSAFDHIPELKTC